MNQPTGFDRDAEQACSLLREYSFELAGYRPSQLVALWQEQLEADSSWIRAAVIEALYQGRYKALSVEQILKVWKRRGHPLRHFNHDFERIVLGPIDPMASRYATLTSLSPSDFLTPQRDTLSAASSPAATPTRENPHPAQAGDTAEAANQQSLSETPPANTASPADPPSPGPEITPQPVASSATEEANAPVQEAAPAAASTVTEMPAESTSVSAITPPSIDYSRAISFSQPEPIQQFVPQPEPSEFYLRLQSVVRQSF